MGGDGLISNQSEIGKGKVGGGAYTWEWRITGYSLWGLQSCYSDSRKGCNSGSEALKKVSVTVKRGMQIY